MSTTGSRTNRSLIPEVPANLLLFINPYLPIPHHPSQPGNLRQPPFLTQRHVILPVRIAIDEPMSIRRSQQVWIVSLFVCLLVAIRFCQHHGSFQAVFLTRSATTSPPSIRRREARDHGVLADRDVDFDRVIKRGAADEAFTGADPIRVADCGIAGG